MGFLIKDALGRSPYWIACYRLADGRQLRKSTKCRDKRQAQIVLQGLEAAELLGATSSATEDQIRSIMSETIFRVTGRKAVDPTIADHMATWLKGVEKTITEGTLKHYRHALRIFEAFLGPRKHARLETISKDLFLAFRDRMQQDGHSPQNINHIFKVLRMPFRIAFDDGLLKHNPVGSIRSLKKTASEKGIFTPAQIIQLLAAAPDEEWRALIALGYWSGGRITDLARLSWDKIDFEQGTLSFHQKKTGGEVLVPIHPELRRHLLALPRGIGKAPLLPRLSKQSGTSTLSSRFSRSIMAAAGIDAGVAREKVGAASKLVAKLSFHSLRHSFTSELARAGVPPEVRQLMTGHATLTSHKRYTHLELDTFSKAIAALPSLPTSS
jgi:integrase